MKPKYKHDCEDCVFLGTVNGMDGYYCKKSWSCSYLLRYSSRDSGYASALDYKDLIYKDVMARSDYSLSGMSKKEVMLDVRRRVLVKLLEARIAWSMVN